MKRSKSAAWEQLAELSIGNIRKCKISYWLWDIKNTVDPKLEITPIQNSDFTLPVTEIWR